MNVLIRLVDPKRLEVMNASHPAVIETGTNFVIVSIPALQKDCLVKGRFSYQSTTNETISHSITMCVYICLLEFCICN